MTFTLFTKHLPTPSRIIPLRRPTRDRRFEALFMKSFVEMQARAANCQDAPTSSAA